MSSSQYLFGYDRDGKLRFEDERGAIRFVQRLEESPNLCDRCYVPLRRSIRLEDVPVQTCRTFDDRTELTEDVPPDKLDKDGGVLEVSRDERHICSCGWIDVAPGETRSRETTIEHLENVLSLLTENGADVNARAARAIVNQAFANRRTGEFCHVAGEAIYAALEDS
ncbi:hypothetical protein [Natronococcus sp. A-GB7]|uniref:hypothetical protein n=1 Tax=Natronococcus sp. A-GB7 TaxID=3037649 RepID=UPI00241E74EC|nr:hypothetical protein [Natronococcus sp. A-GB7]MDG5821850.1 hypothetical protein [Natronococcus sp. A-GB7]